MILIWITSICLLMCLGELLVLILSLSGVIELAQDKTEILNLIATTSATILAGVVIWDNWNTRNREKRKCIFICDVERGNITTNDYREYWSRGTKRTAYTGDKGEIIAQTIDVNFVDKSILMRSVIVNIYIESKFVGKRLVIDKVSAAVTKNNVYIANYTASDNIVCVENVIGTGNICPILFNFALSDKIENQADNAIYEVKFRVRFFDKDSRYCYKEYKTLLLEKKQDVWNLLALT